ncbi:MAG: hypothetical protein J6J41_00935 [Clostridia bacterium]|nr:hypothetical protein [Clostridia bacterium]
MEIINEKEERGLIRRSSIRYMIPLMLGMLFAQSAPMVDAICVSGKLGEDALSALITVMPLGYLISTVGTLGGLGAGVFIAKCSGSGEKAKAARVFSRTMLMMTVFTAFIALLAGIFHEPVLSAFCATEENRDFAREYMLITLIGSPVLVVAFAAEYFLLNDNNETLSMIGAIAGAAANILVDYIGIYALNGGIGAAALGTVMGSVVTCLVFLLHFRKKDRLCRFTSPRRREGDPSLLELIKPGAAEGVMYFLLGVQLLIQNFVLKDSAGTSGLGNSAVIENLQLFITIFMAGATDVIYPIASSYYGEQNRSGVLLAKRTLARISYMLLVPIVVLLCAFPEIMINLYAIDDQVMLDTLPWGIRIVSATALLDMIGALLMDFLSSAGKETKATITMVIQLSASCLLAILLEKPCGIDAPWYADLLAGIAALIYLIFFGENAFKGLLRFYPENLRMLTGGKLTGQNLEAWLEASADMLTEQERQLVSEQITGPLQAAIPEGKRPNSTWTILERDDGRKAVVLRYEDKTDYLDRTQPLEKKPDEEETIVFNECIRSEFIGTQRMMLVLDHRE